MNLIVDKVYVINLNINSKRYLDFSIMLKRMNIKYERINAIDGLLIDKNSEDTKKYINKFTWLSKKEKGCMLSHIKIWESIVNNKEIKRILIFEDDARTYVSGDTLTNLLKDFYYYINNNNINEPDMLYLGKSLDYCIDYKKIWNNVYTTTHPMCLHSYIITPNGASKLLSIAPYTQAIDMIPSIVIKSHNLNAMTFHPSIFFQDIFNTNSSLRNFNSAINNTCECITPQYHISLDTWYFVIIVLISMISSIFLAIILD